VADGLCEAAHLGEGAAEVVPRGAFAVVVAEPGDGVYRGGRGDGPVLEVALPVQKRSQAQRDVDGVLAVGGCAGSSGDGGD
jgi:hypothetical protein